MLYTLIINAVNYLSSITNLIQLIIESFRVKQHNLYLQTCQIEIYIVVIFTQDSLL